jgi:hypothetical protein
MFLYLTCDSFSVLPSSVLYLCGLVSILVLLVETLQEASLAGASWPIVGSSICPFLLHSVDGIRDIECLFEGTNTWRSSFTVTSSDRGK